MAELSALGVEARHAKAAARAEAEAEPVRPGETFFDVLRRKLDEEPEKIIDQMLTSKNAVALTRLAELALDRGKPAEPVPEPRGLELEGQRVPAPGVGDVIWLMFEIRAAGGGCGGARAGAREGFA